METKLPLSNIETIPLPLAGIIFSDALHEEVLKQHGIEAGIVLLERNTNEYIVNSISGFSAAQEHIPNFLKGFAEDLSQEVRGIDRIKPAEEISLFNKENLNQLLSKTGFDQAKIFSLHDFLDSPGYWIIFFRNEDDIDLKSANIHDSIDFRQLIESLKATIKQQAKTNFIDEIIKSWVKMLDVRDKETEEHTRRVANLAQIFATASGFTKTEAENIYRGAMLHDIGKIVIPNSILNKPGPLSRDEWEIMKMHPFIAMDLLSKFNLPNDIVNIPISHHEEWLGSGYPQGLKGKEIPISARLFSIIDVWDALNSDRPYRPKFSRKKTLTYIESQAGIKFDPGITQSFLEFISQFNP